MTIVRRANGIRCGALPGIATLASFLLAAGGCAPLSAPGGDFVGVTGGGQEDIARARQQIESGYLPEPDSITIEAFLSEHEIPIAPPADAGELFAAVGVAYRQPFGEPAPMADVFVGLGTTIDLDAFQRRPLNLALVIDRSGSMNYTWDDPYGYFYQYGPTYYGPFSAWLNLIFPPPPPPPPSGTTKMDSTKAALHTLVEQLDADDLLTVISFNTEWTVDVPATFVTDKAALHGAIDRLKAEGGTNIFAPLERGFQLVEQQRSAARLDRVILFTDAQPNVGPQGSADFVPLVAQFAARGIGLTLMGVGFDFGDALGREISRLRGGNSFFLDGAERIGDLFQNEFKFFVTPAAHDLRLSVQVVEGVGIRDVYGVADYVPGRNTAEATIPTLFFSPREGAGAIVMRLTSAQPPDFSAAVSVGELSLAYTPIGGAPREQRLALTLPAGTSATGDPPYYSQPDLALAAVLLDAGLTLRQATELVWSGNYDAAEKLIDEFLVYYDTATLGLSDRIDASSRGLRDERELLIGLRGIANYRY